MKEKIREATNNLPVCSFKTIAAMSGSLDSKLFVVECNWLTVMCFEKSIPVSFVSYPKIHQFANTFGEEDCRILNAWLSIATVWLTQRDWVRRNTQRRVCCTAFKLSSIILQCGYENGNAFVRNKATWEVPTSMLRLKVWWYFRNLHQAYL